MRLPLSIVLIALPVCAQHFSAGIKGGVPLTDFIQGASTQNFTFVTNTNRYVIGGQAELHLIAGFSVELDALYRHFSYNNTTTGVTTTITSVNSGAWEFPLLAKYRFPAPIVRPFIDAGVAWDRLTGLKQAVSTLSGGAIAGSPNDNKDTTTGFVIGVGADIHVLIHIQPEIRYTRWGSQHFPNLAGGVNSNQNQAEFLVGITF